MTTENLQEICERLAHALRVEDVFGMPEEGASKSEVAARVRAEYHRLSRLVHPDLHAHDADSLEMANDACAQLNGLYQRAEARIEAGQYGRASAPESTESQAGEGGIDLAIGTRHHRYHLSSVVAEGDLATLYGGTCLDSDPGDPGIVAKVAIDSADNDLLQREAAALRRLWSTPGAQTRHLPVLLDQFKTTQGQLGNVLRRLDGLDGHTLRERLPGGVPSEHAVWIMERLLSVVGYAHSRGMLHGNIEPSHIIVRPRDHNLYLVDWCYAVIEPARTGDTFRCFNADYHPPEVERRGAPTPAADLYALGKSMIHLLGGDPRAGTFPDRVEERLRRFISFFVLASPRQRAQDAWEMHGQLRQLRQEVFGSPRFIEFTV